MSDETNQIIQDLPSLDHLDKIVESLALLINMQCERDERETQSFDSLKNQLNMLQEQVQSLGAAQRTETDDIDSEIAATFESTILEEYGLLLDETESEPNEYDTSKSDDAEPVDVVTPTLSAQDENDDQPTDQAIDENRGIPPLDLEEINALKVELRQTLRDAEIELSITRAKLRQREASLEEREAQLERETKLKTVVETDNKPHGILDRLKIHLNGFSPLKANDSQATDSERSESSQSDESKSDDQAK